MSTISLAMIVKNEEKTLARCLNSIKEAVDEIIIVDTGSTDSTKQIAKKFTNNVYDFEWVNDFSKARNYAFSLSTSDNIMWLDADDVVPKTTLEKIKILKTILAPQKIDMVFMLYATSFNLSNEPTFKFYRERIVKNHSGYIWQDPVHEAITPSGNIFYLNHYIEHRKDTIKKYSNRNLKIYQDLISTNVVLSPRQQFYYARELMYNNKISASIKVFEKYLKNDSLWLENRINAHIDLYNCYLIKNNIKKARNTLIKTLEFTTPRAEIMCKIADTFLMENDIDTAIFWYKLALNYEPNIRSGGFFQMEYYNIYPLLNLCVCYHKKGDDNLAKEYNDKAGKVDPKNEPYLKNKKFFSRLKK